MRPWEHGGGCLLSTKDSLKMKRGENNERKQYGGGHKYINKCTLLETKETTLECFLQVPGKMRDINPAWVPAWGQSIDPLPLPPSLLWREAWAVWGRLNYRGLISMDEKQVWHPYLCLSVCVCVCVCARPCVSEGAGSESLSPSLQASVSLCQTIKRIRLLLFCIFLAVNILHMKRPKPGCEPVSQRSPRSQSLQSGCSFWRTLSDRSLKCICWRLLAADLYTFSARVITHSAGKVHTGLNKIKLRCSCSWLWNLPLQQRGSLKCSQYFWAIMELDGI